MTPTALTPHVSAAASSRRQRRTVGAPIFYVADPWQDWKRHYARLRDNHIVKIWNGGRPVVLPMCGLLGQTGTEVRHAEDCDACKHTRGMEQSASERQPLPRTQGVAA